MGVLLSPANPIKKKIKWALVVHTVALFLFLTIPVGIDLNYLFITYIENREFPGDDEHPPGPLGYDDRLHNKAAFSVFNFMFPLNQWLADGLLVSPISDPVVWVSNVLMPLTQLHRCFVIYSMNHSVMAFPYLMYLASIGMCPSSLKADGHTMTNTPDVAVGVAHIYLDSGSTDASVNLNTAYLTICLSLNVLLTLMIVIRLVVHIRNVRRVIGDSEGSGGLHTAATTVVTMLIESYALYAIAILLFIVPWVVHSAAVDLFSKVLGTIQVRSVFIFAPMCCCLRTPLFNLVAHRSLLRT